MTTQLSRLLPGREIVHEGPEHRQYQGRQQWATRSLLSEAPSGERQGHFLLWHDELLFRVTSEPAELTRAVQYLSLILSLSLFTPLSAQSPCLPEGITFTTQGQIDSFAINYPDCNYVLGTVRI